MTAHIKVCGLTRRVDAELAAAAGAAFGGVILAPGGKRSVSASLAAALFSGLPLRRVGVFVNASEEELRSAADVAALDVIQLHGDEDPDFASRVRASHPGRAVWKAVRPRSGQEFAEAADRFASVVDGLLLDGWSPAARGGTGHRFPWEAVARFRERLPAEVDLVVAGGLRADNVGRAIALLRPAVVDVSSGVESAPGIKDPEAIAAFVAAARASATNSELRDF